MAYVNHETFTHLGEYEVCIPLWYVTSWGTHLKNRSYNLANTCLWLAGVILIDGK